LYHNVEINVEQDRPQRALCGGKFRWLTHTEYVILITSLQQHWLREHIEQLRYTNSASSVPCCVPLLCTCTVCSVYRVPSVIMCSSSLILQSLAVTAVRFEMRYQFSTCALRAYYQYRCTTICRTHVCMCTSRALVLYTCIHAACLYSDTHWGSERRRISRADVREDPPKVRPRNGFLNSKSFAPNSGCEWAILIAATIVAEIKIAGDL